MVAWVPGHALFGQVGVGTSMGVWAWAILTHVLAHDCSTKPFLLISCQFNCICVVGSAPSWGVGTLSDNLDNVSVQGSNGYGVKV